MVRKNVAYIHGESGYFKFREHNSVMHPTVSLPEQLNFIQLGPIISPFHLDDGGVSCHLPATLDAIKVWFLASYAM